jgi:hypothetical protein
MLRWGTMFSIFRRSADIKLMLPDDTSRFEEAHTEYQVRETFTHAKLLRSPCGPRNDHQSQCPSLLAKALMREAQDRPNALEACTTTGRLQQLEGIFEQLELCRRALQVRKCYHISKMSHPRHRTSLTAGAVVKRTTSRRNDKHFLDFTLWQ